VCRLKLDLMSARSEKAVPLVYVARWSGPLFPWYSASSLSATIPIGPTPSGIALEPPNVP